MKKKANAPTIVQNISSTQAEFSPAVQSFNAVTFRRMEGMSRRNRIQRHRRPRKLGR